MAYKHPQMEFKIKYQGDNKNGVLANIVFMLFWIYFSQKLVNYQDFQ